MKYQIGKHATLIVFQFYVNKFHFINERAGLLDHFDLMEGEYSIVNISS